MPRINGFGPVGERGGVTLGTHRTRVARREPGLYVVFLAGGIGSGKSSVGRELERRGAWRIDLDQLSRSVLEAGSPCLDEVAAAFGADLLDAQTGELDRGLLAERAFATPETAARLEAIELPYIKELLVHALEGGPCAAASPEVCLVEVPLLDRMETMLDLADEIVCVACPYETRRLRACLRGMDAADFDARAANQPSDEYLAAHADTLLDNAGAPGVLMEQIDAWWEARAAAGWKGGRRG